MSMKTSDIIRRKLQELAASKTASKEAGDAPVPALPSMTAVHQQAQARREAAEESSDASAIEYNEQQKLAIDTVLSGKSCVITGAAGTGKTTVIRGTISQLLRSERITPIGVTDHKHLAKGAPGIVCVSFTNKAVNNMKKVLPADLHGNCITLHKLLEYQPEFYEVYDPETGASKTTMRFTHTRHAGNPLPAFNVLIIDEATMVSVDMWNLAADAVAHNVQVVIVGDIHQLPPVFGKSIFIWAMQLGAPVIELTHVYRQALESPIISLATHIRQGKQIPATRFDEFNKDSSKGKVTIKPWKKKLSDAGATKVIQMFLTELIDQGGYDPMMDVILTPYNKGFGTVAMNTAVASHLAKKETVPEKKQVWEIFSGVRKKYLRVGDKVLYQKSEAYIESIVTNGAYYGKTPRPPSDTMDYDGIESDPEKRMQAAMLTGKHSGMASLDSVDAMLAHFASHTDEEEKVSQEASHKITLYVADTDSTVELTSSGDINALELGYAITVHKSQGSEYNRVLFITHGSQSNMLYRELIYTAITRAARELYIICEPNLFLKGVTSQRVLGTTIEEKIANFDKQVKLSGRTGKGELPAKPWLLVPETAASHASPDPSYT